MRSTPTSASNVRRDASPSSRSIFSLPTPIPPKSSEVSHSRFLTSRWRGVIFALAIWASVACLSVRVAAGREQFMRLGCRIRRYVCEFTQMSLA